MLFKAYFLPIIIPDTFLKQHKQLLKEVSLLEDSWEEAMLELESLEDPDL